VLSDHKCCSSCRSSLPFGSFNKNRTEADGLMRYCRDCQKAFSAACYQKNKDKWKPKYAARKKEWDRKNSRSSNLRIKYGVTEQQFDQASAAIGGVCEICGKQCVTGKRLSVDHDHDTGFVRGLLCMKCNSGIGKFGDSIELLKAAVEYMARGSSESIQILNSKGVVTCSQTSKSTVSNG